MRIQPTVMVALAVYALMAFTSAPEDGHGPARAAATDPPPRELQVDPLHSSVVFRVRHLDAAWFYGRFNRVGGSFRFDPDGGSFVRVEVDAKSVDTNSEGRDRHLKSQDFLNAVQFPKITFESTSVKKTGDDTWRVTGDLTLCGKRREVSFDARHTGSGKVSERFGFRAGFAAEVTIERSDFGVSYGIQQKVLGDEVRLIIALEGMEPR